MLQRQGISRIIIQWGTGLIALLWFYAALSKLIDLQHFSDAMRKQPISGSLQTLLTVSLPVTELLIGASLLTTKFHRIGLWGSALMLLLFTGYIALILHKAFGHVPCSCGGIIGQLGWSSHLWFNLSFLALDLVIIFYLRKERRSVTKSKTDE